METVGGRLADRRPGSLSRRGIARESPAFRRKGSWKSGEKACRSPRLILNQSACAPREGLTPLVCALMTLAPELSCWEQHQIPQELPAESDFLLVWTHAQF